MVRGRHLASAPVDPRTIYHTAEVNLIRLIITSDQEARQAITPSTMDRSRRPTKVHIRFHYLSTRQSCSRNNELSATTGNISTIKIHDKQVFLLNLLRPKHSCNHSHVFLFVPLFRVSKSTHFLTSQFKRRIFLSMKLAMLRQPRQRFLVFELLSIILFLVNRLHRKRRQV
ncbi:hypothetical protein EJ05DRAFT_32758 [Pseudovirgaria hyperparasitica]|uniref:Uncharacterized protein n=1 Tax=Pseudovirgaria hyperparasitica TaxID=470096 RepID=A0A6A6WM46_9PEZI|nr:uncharacterized protein EJ05DRAFT_32758 [Pseudovirgaria hyperparasitica]KAF2763275.1 hypothetical protein EJ05DRAFT_32758 [Pseudovirgaria hyperparasitica]